MSRLIGRMLGSSPSARDSLSEQLATVVSFDRETRTYRVNYRGVEMDAPQVGSVIARPGATVKLLLTGKVPSGIAAF